MARNQIIPIFVPHGGCPHTCVFCDQVKITGTDTAVTGEGVREAIREGLGASGRGAEVAFYGGSFTAILPERQQELLGAVQPFLDSGAAAAIRLSTRPDALDDETIRRLKQYRVETVELGCQSMDDRVLTLTERGHTARQAEEAARRLKAAGFRVILQMMTGLPGDQGQASRETAKRLIALRPEGVRIYPTVVLRGTALEEKMKAGEYTPQSVEAAVELCVELYEMFLAANIPVIRLGLNPTELLSAGTAVAGAYHPALGEKVLSRMYLRRVEGLLSGVKLGERLVISVHPKRISVMVGQKRENLRALQEKYRLKQVKVVPEAQELWEITLKNA